jgi:hypothetical protein
MGKHWVYIIKNDGDEYKDIYIGETTRLYRRMNEHCSGNGAKNTSYFDRVELVGLYNVSCNSVFEEYNRHLETFEEWNSIWDLEFTIKKLQYKIDNDEPDFLMIENLITEMCIYIKKEADDTFVKGGKYTKDKCYRNDIKTIKNHRPFCKCGYPAEVFLSQKDEFWFKCGVANASWVEFENDSFIKTKKCDFISKYTSDMILREKLENLQKRASSDIINKIPHLINYNCKVANNSRACCLCKILKYRPVFKNGYRAICRTCIEKRFEEIDKLEFKYAFVIDSDEDL